MDIPSDEAPAIAGIKLVAPRYARANPLGRLANQTTITPARNGLLRQSIGGGIPLHHLVSDFWHGEDVLRISSLVAQFSPEALRPPFR